MERQDLRILLALARHGSAVGAARELRLAHTTVIRHVAAIEARVGHAIFVRIPDGMVPTAEGEQILTAASAVEAAMMKVERRLGGLGRRVDGTLRLATTLPLAELLLPRLVILRDTAPELQLEVLVSQRVVDVTRHRAEVAVWHTALGAAPDAPDVIAERIGAEGFAAFASAAYCAAHGISADRTVELHAHQSIEYAGELAWPAAHAFAAPADRGGCALTTNDPHCALAAVAAGWGVALLPCSLGRRRGLVQVGAPVTWCDIHAVFPADLARDSRVRTIVDTVAEVLRRDADLLGGDVPAM